jgi:hypothetical protein
MVAIGMKRTQMYFSPPKNTLHNRYDDRWSIPIFVRDVCHFHSVQTVSEIHAASCKMYTCICHCGENSGDMIMAIHFYLVPRLKIVELQPRSPRAYLWDNACNSGKSRWNQFHLFRIAWSLCPSSGILNNYKTQRFGNWIYFCSQVRRWRHYSVGPLK